MDQTNNEHYMALALKLAKKAYKNKDVPVGCVIVYDGKVIAKSYNMRQKKSISTYHAEIIAINKACKKLKRWNLTDCEMYVTLEPCIMCTGAIIQSRIKRVYFGTYEPKSGCLTSVMQIGQNNNFNHKVECIGGILEEECSNIMKEFFKELRNNKK